MPKNTKKYPNIATFLSFFNLSSQCIRLRRRNAYLRRKLSRQKNISKDLAMVFPSYFVGLDRRGRVMVMNDLLSSMLGVNLKSIRGREFFNSFVLEKYRKAFDSALSCISAQSRGPARITVGLRGKDSEVFFVDFTVGVSGRRRSSLGSYYAVGQDSTVSKAAEDALRVSEDRFRSLADLLPMGVFVTDLAGRYTYVNSQWLSMTGLTIDEIGEDGWVKCLLIEDREAALLAWKNTVEKQLQWSRELRFVDKRGESRRVQSKAVPVFSVDGAGEGYVGVIVDITQEVRFDEHLRRSAAGREPLLKELKHRVKNNLQIVLSLLNLQLLRGANPQAHSFFRESQQRIKAIDLLLEELYDHHDLEYVEMGAFCRKIVCLMPEFFKVDDDSVSVTVDFCSARIGIDQALPCGLIIYELVSNVFKHSLRGGVRGVMHISGKLDDGMFSVAVRDDGPGFPDRFELKNSRNLGLQLVQMFAEQLDGRFVIGRENGFTVCSVAFPYAEVRKRALVECGSK
jgi:PAS domain S-box-containing protein